jgi:hypothetical protein
LPGGKERKGEDLPGVRKGDKVEVVPARRWRQEAAPGLKVDRAAAAHWAVGPMFPTCFMKNENNEFVSIVGDTCYMLHLISVLGERK